MSVRFVPSDKNHISIKLKNTSLIASPHSPLGRIQPDIKGLLKASIHKNGASPQSFPKYNNIPSNFKISTPHPAIKVLHNPMTDAQKDVFKQSSLKLSYPYDYFVANTEEGGEILKNILPAKTLEALQNLKDNKIDLIILRNMPVTQDDKELIPTPDSGQSRPRAKKDYHSESLLLGLANIMGNIPRVKVNSDLGYITQEAFSQLIPDTDKNEPELGPLSKDNYHTGEVSDSVPPEYTFLATLRGDEAAKLSFLSIGDIMKELDQETINLLKKKKFEFRAKNEDDVTIAPIITQNIKNKYEIRFNQNANRMIALEEPEKKALEKFKDTIQKMKPSMTLSVKQGDILLLRNNRLLVSRNAYKESRPPHQKRWLQKLHSINMNKNFSLNLFSDSTRQSDIHYLTPTHSSFKNIQQFIKRSGDSEKYELLNKISFIANRFDDYEITMQKNKQFDHFEIVIHTPSGKTSNLIKINGTTNKKQPINSDSIQIGSENFISYKDKNAPYVYITSRKKGKYKDISHFNKKADNAEKIELFNILKKNISGNDKVIISSKQNNNLNGFYIKIEKQQQEK